LFNRIQEIQPKTLYVAADGPSKNKRKDEENCARTRELFNNINWECRVEKLYRKENLGCKLGVSSAIDWFFNNVEEGIILEDDCLPDITYFQYCAQLLDYYRNDERIFSISGTNILGQWKSDKQDYHFSHHVSVWGWASWRRAWKYFDPEMKDWSDPEVKSHIASLIGDKKIYRQKSKFFDATLKGLIDTWDHQWAFAHYRYSAYSIIPSINLISNIGFNTDATHTKLFYPKISNKESYSIKLPLRINQDITVDKEYENKLVRKFSNLRIKNIFRIKFIQSVIDYLIRFFK
jgi:hypothetical protein